MSEDESIKIQIKAISTLEKNLEFLSQTLKKQSETKNKIIEILDTFDRR
jgi:uncharacterized protein with von Willebrand factor type A (vWA) domain